MAGKYDSKVSEKKWQDFWEQERVYAFDLHDTTRPVYSIDTPPPTVSGKLHIGHIFSYTQAECLARFKRMNGHNVFYPMGYDDNGIPTEILVEKELGINIKDTARQDFVAKCLEVNQKYRDIYKWLRQSLGMSVDRERSYATILPEVQAISQKHFVDLLQKGVIYKKEFPALRCTKNQTTIAQAETEEQEFNEFFNDIQFVLSDGTACVIATTRPEMIPACVAVFVHPEDARYTSYIGQHATTPFGVQVPVLADDKVKMDKGTGAVMCCSYGDEVDMYWIKKHNLPEKIIINRYGKIENSGLAELDGLKVADARNAIIPLLEEKGVLLKREAIVQSKTISERGKVPVEIIPVPQWFVRILDDVPAVKEMANSMNRHPEHMKKRLFDWVDRLQWDWNISRNRKFGIPIPVRYSKKTGELILPSADQFPVDPLSDVPKDLPAGHTADDIIGDEMVMDTWFTSWLTPHINQEFLRAAGSSINIIPMSLRPQAHDIIRTRLLYTTLQNYHKAGTAPFKDIMMSGHVLAGKGEKISKSKGNAKFEPVTLLDTFWADATRYWALSGQLGKDMAFDEVELKNGQKLVTKLWNAANFVQMQLEGWSPDVIPSEVEGSHKEEISPFHSLHSFQSKWRILYPTDKWILSRLDEVIEKMRKNLESYEIGLAKIHFEEFFWRDFCDTYLEMVKTRVYQPERFVDGQAKKESGQYTLYTVMYAIIRLLAPYIPHVTEEIYQVYFREYERVRSLHLCEFPQQITDYRLQTSEDGFDIVLQVVADVRKYKTDKQISLGAEISTLTISASGLALAAIQAVEDDIVWVTKAKAVEYVEGEYGIMVND